LQNDKSGAIGGTALGTARQYLQQKAKIGAPVEPNSTQVIIKDILSSLENADPTNNKEYTQWLAKLYANAGIKMEDLLSRGSSALKQYHIFKTKKLLPADYRDIGRIDFNTLEGIASNPGLLQALSDKEEQEQAKNMPKGDFEVGYDDADVRIIVPHDEDAAKYYGQGTRWCTAAKNNNMFNRYNKDGRMYILLPKHPEHDGEKYQLHFDSGQFMDEQDSEVDLNHLLQTRFPGIFNFFKEHEPVISTWVAYAPDEILQPIINEIKELMMDEIHEVLSEWENGDGYYYQWLDENGYTIENEDGSADIDWDRVANDNVDYLSYNDEAKNWYTDIEDALSPTPETCREIALNISADYSDNVELTDFDKCIVFNIDENTDDNMATDRIKKSLAEDILVRHDAKGYYVQKRDYKGNLPKARTA
jgi:hypothetical protein